jgi:hypothetical protein
VIPEAPRGVLIGEGREIVNEIVSSAQPADRVVLRSVPEDPMDKPAAAAPSATEPGISEASPRRPADVPTEELEERYRKLTEGGKTSAEADAIAAVLEDRRDAA